MVAAAHAPRLLKLARRACGASLLLILAGAIYMRSQGLVSIEGLVRWAQGAGAAAPLGFGLAYAAMIVLLLPTLPLNLAAGFLWGPWIGTVVSVSAAVAGAGGGFLLARFAGPELLEGGLDNPLWRRLDTTISRYGWKAVAFTRINPVFPFGPVNYYFGLTSVRLRDFLWSTALFVLPPSFAFAMVGHAFESLVLEGPSYEVFRAVLVISAVVTAWTLGRMALRGEFALEGDAESAPDVAEFEPGLGET